MSKERELLREIMGYIASGVVSITSNDLGDAAETLHEIQELLLQHEQGFVGYLYKQMDCHGDWAVRFKFDKPYITSHEIKDIVPIYTAPPKIEPLSDEALCEILLKKEWKGLFDLSRAIEKAHGIGADDE